LAKSKGSRRLSLAWSGVAEDPVPVDAIGPSCNSLKTRFTGAQDPISGFGLRSPIGWLDDSLEQLLLLGAAVSLRTVDACQLYVVSRSPDDENVIWVTELWADRDGHTASLDSKDTRRLIERAMPLMAQPPESSVLQPVGGKSVALRGG
jgi:quinol monooxygenase YgiN